MDQCKLKVKCVETMDVIFHGFMDDSITLVDVSYVPGLGFNLYSLHAVQKAHLIVSDASGTYVIGTNRTFPRRSRGSYLRATGLPAGTVGAKNGNETYMCATNVIRRLRHLVPPLPQDPPPPPLPPKHVRDWYA